MTQDDRSTLTVDVRPGERLRISGQKGIEVELIHKSGQVARLKVSAPRDVIVQKEQRTSR